MKVNALNVDGIDNDRKDAEVLHGGAAQATSASCVRAHVRLTVKVSLAGHMIRTRFEQDITRRWWKVPTGTKSYRVAKTFVKGDAFGAEQREDRHDVVD